MKSTSPKRVGILGGTFDPIHYGHLLTAQAALEACDLDGVYFVPAGEPPHKNGQMITSAIHRKKMVELAIRDHPSFEISNFEMNQKAPSYTVHLLHHFHKKLPDSELNFILGADTLLELESWYHFEELFDLTRFIVVKRQMHTDADLLKKTTFLKNRYQASIQLINAVRMDVSSSEIRKRAATNRSIQYLTPEKVLKYIQTNHLYQGAMKGSANDYQ